MLDRNFNARFEVVPAVDEQLREAAYRLRHAVYCEEFGFEGKNAREMEVDRYDRHSSALLIREVSSREFIACARIVHPDPSAPNEPLPFELATAGSLDQAALSAQPIPRHSIGEISRLSIAARFRGPPNASSPRHADRAALRQSAQLPLLLAGLYLAIVSLAHIRGVERLYLLTEPRFAEHIARVGVRIVRIGEAVEHRGLRIPSMIPVADVERYLEGSLKLLYQSIRQNIARDLTGIGRP